MDLDSFNLSECLSKILPEGLKVDFYHVSTPAVKSSPLFSSPPSHKPQPSTVESHFMAFSHDSILIFAIEILVYTTTRTNQRMIFISKADSSGYLPTAASSFVPQDAPNTRISVLRTLAITSVKYVVDRSIKLDPTTKTTISLFARSQTQYLFPNSAVNPLKHVLDDRSLISWWGKVLDPIFRCYTKTHDCNAYMLVPGSDHLQVGKLLPISNDESHTSWTHGHPFKINPANDITVREVIPHFPDDPKARFLDELNSDDNESQTSKRGKQWANIQTVDDFWDLMCFRQECSLGRSVGFLWVVIDPHITTETLSADSQIDSNAQCNENPVALNKSGEESINEPNDRDEVVVPKFEQTFPFTSAPKSPTKRPAFDPLSSRKRRRPLSIGQSRQSIPTSGACILFDEKRYQRAVDAILNHTDFGNAENAKSSSQKWVQSLIAMRSDGVEDCKIVINGTRAVCPKSINQTLDYKRLKDSPDCKIKNDCVNILGNSLVRKKKKHT
ncbi:histone acetylation protein-domain-containing protein [Geopyxis carbonaria]|nr:histone acetylation protein-domain-containing protein [Geopyxis carbonaria]